MKDGLIVTWGRSKNSNWVVLTILVSLSGSPTPRPSSNNNRLKERVEPTK